MSDRGRLYIAAALAGFAFVAGPMTVIIAFSRASNNFPGYAPLIGGGIAAVAAVGVLALIEWGTWP